MVDKQSKYFFFLPMTEYEQKLYDVIADWWDEVFARPRKLDKNDTIIDLVKSISEINALKEWSEDAQKYYD